MAIQTNLTIDQGTDFQAVIKLYSTVNAPLDLTDYGAHAEMRRSYDSTTASGVFSVAIPVPINGELYLTMEHTSTAAIRYGRYLYDIIVTESSTGIRTRAVEGIVTVMPGVTR